jgi:glucokinase
MKTISSKEFVLAGDIGGTKTNLALFSPNKKRPVLWVRESYSSRDASSLEELVEVFLTQHPETVSSVCFGIAGPVTKGSVKTTNLPWVVSERKLRDRFTWKKVRLMNDLAATAVSIAALGQSEVFGLNPGKTDPEGTVGVVAPGTGLGIALLVFVKGQRYPLPSEGGHVDFAPKDAQEIELLRHLLGQRSHVSVERLVSGPGLLTIYSWLKEYRGHTEPKWLQEMFTLKDASQVISEAALAEKEPLCVESLDMFVSILGSVAGNLALTGMTTGGIYLAGGICPKILPKLTEAGFMKAFTAKGRFEEFLSGIPVRVILNDKAALLGAACCASELLA